MAHASPEAEVLGGLRAGQVEAVGVLEDGRVAVGRAEQQPQLGPLGHRHPVDLHVLQHPALEHLQGGVVAQQLVDRPGQQAGLAAEPGQLVGVAEQLPPADAGEVHGGLVAGVEQQHHGADELVLGELVAAVDHLGEGGGQAVGEPGPPGPTVPPR